MNYSSSEQNTESAKQLLMLGYQAARGVRRIGVEDGNGELSLSQLAALEQLRGGAQTMSQLAEAIGTSMPGATAVVDRLESAGWVIRSDDSSDRRKVLISLTDLGQSALKRGVQVKVERLQIILDRLDTKDVTDLQRILRKLSDAFSEEATRPQGRTVDAR